jgi:hypothetical protein
MIPFIELCQPDQMEVLSQHHNALELYPGWIADFEQHAAFLSCTPLFEVYALKAAPAALESLLGRVLEITVLTKDMTVEQYRDFLEHLGLCLVSCRRQFPGVALRGQHLAHNKYARRLFDRFGFDSKPWSTNPEVIIRTLL